MTLLKREKLRYAQERVRLFGHAAQDKGVFRNSERDFCLPENHAAENLFKEIRLEAVEYFKKRSIRWHTGPDDGKAPSNHLCSSQVCCVNFLFPFADNPELLTRVLSRIYPDVAEALPIISTEEQPLSSGSFPFVAFEWVGQRDYLGESRRGGKRTRGANFTSADFLFRYRRKDGYVHVVLGEWKYTETYGVTDRALPVPGSGAVRLKTYGPAYSKTDGVFRRDARDAKLYPALFYEPLYQLMRLQLLAQEMQRFHELEAHSVSVLHLSPAANGELRVHAPSPYLAARYPGKGTLDTWAALIAPEDFKSLSVESLRSLIEEESRGTAPEWIRYLTDRYGWVPAPKSENYVSPHSR